MFTKLGYKILVETQKPGNAMVNAQKPGKERVSVQNLQGNVHFRSQTTSSVITNGHQVILMQIWLKITQKYH